MGILRIVFGIPKRKSEYKYHLTPRQTYYREVYLQSPHWKEFRRQYWIRHPMARCVRCGKGRPLDLHHISYINMYKETDKDVIPLCRAHHKLEHRKH